MRNNSSAASPTTSRIARWSSWLLAAARILVGLFFASAGLPKLIQHASYVPSFEHWQVPFPGLSVFAVGLLETIGGVLLVVGVAAVPVPALLLIDMLAAFGVRWHQGRRPVHRLTATSWDFLRPLHAKRRGRLAALGEGPAIGSPLG